jgi:predicted DNA-binding transcriptional regulator YafY
MKDKKKEIIDIKKEERFKIIHKCFIEATEPLAKKELMSAIIEESIIVTDITRNLSRDLKAMKEIKKAPILITGKGKSTRYAYSTKNYSLNGDLISVDNLFTLEYACSVLEQIEHLDLHEELSELKQELEKSKEDDYEIKNKNALYLEKSNLVLKQKTLNSLFQACSLQTVLKIQYRPFFPNESTEFEFHPFFLQCFNGRWFCIGYNAIKQKISNCALDRIEKIKNSTVEFDTSKFISKEEYNKNLYGITRLGEPEEVVFQMTEGRAPYYISKPFFKYSKKEQLPNGNFQFTLKVIINPELKSILLSYGSDLQVISPDSLKKNILKSVKEILKGF